MAESAPKLPFWLETILAALLSVLRSTMRADGGMASEPSVERLGNAIGDAQALADLAERYTVDQAAQGTPTSQPIEVPQIPFSEAVRNLIGREPQYAPTAKEVRDVYRRNGFALARASSREVAERVQKMLGEALIEGTPRPSVVAAIAELGPWTQAYAETVYRTNMATARTAGRFQQLQDPKVRALIPALQFITAEDVDVRRGRPQDHGENHQAMAGIIAAVDHPIWDRFSPPGGYNCRCSVRTVGIKELETRGLLLPDGSVKEPPDPVARGARFYPGFGRRPDTGLYR